MEARLVVVDENGRADVHCIDETEALAHFALSQGRLDLRGDVQEFPAHGDFEPEFFAKRFHGAATKSVSRDDRSAITF
jgi:hypothetical protein